MIEINRFFRLNINPAKLPRTTTRSQIQRWLRTVARMVAEGLK